MNLRSYPTIVALECSTVAFMRYNSVRCTRNYLIRHVIVRGVKLDFFLKV